MEGAKSLQRGVHHVDDLANIEEVLADRAIRQAEGADAHLVSNLLPILQVGLQTDREPGGVTGELHAATVGEDEVSLGRLVKAEFNHVVVVLGVPGRIDLVDGVLGDTPIVVLLEDETICDVANHDFKLRVQLGLGSGVQGGHEGGGRAPRRGRRHGRGRLAHEPFVGFVGLQEIVRNDVRVDGEVRRDTHNLCKLVLQLLGHSPDQPRLARGTTRGDILWKPQQAVLPRGASACVP